MNTENKKTNQIILLNGKSVKNIKDYKIQDNDTIYAVNRKSAIEKLLPSNRNIDVWAVCSKPEFYEMYDEICEFLARDEDNRLITLSRTIFNSKYLMEIKPLPNPNKIILLDFLVDKVENVFEINQINTFAIVLAVLGISKQKNILLFGCDGVKDRNAKDIYFNQKSLSKARIANNDIYDDMINFDKYYPKFIKAFNIDTNFIQNINPDSYYKSFHKFHKPVIHEGKDNKFIINTLNYTNTDLFLLAIASKNLDITYHLDRKIRNSLMKRIKKIFKKTL